MSAYRTNAGPQVAERPALTWWQQAVVQVVPERELTALRWYRAHVGGWWMYGSSILGDGAALWYLASRWPEMHRVVTHGHCRHEGCEVYPYAALGAGPCPVVETRAPGWHVISRSDAVLHVEEHVLSDAERAALDVGPNFLRGRR